MHSGHAELGSQNLHVNWAGIGALLQGMRVAGVGIVPDDSQA